MIKELLTAFVITLTACSLPAAEYHVSPSGLDANAGSKSKPFKTIAAAAHIGQPGDVITVHEGTYRERVNPPRGGASDDKRIVYQAAAGEKVVIKGSEIVTGWKKVQGDLWNAVLPNSFFGDFNPFNDLIAGDWFNRRGREHHTGSVYLNGHWLVEAARKEQLFNGGQPQKAKGGNLFNLAWMRQIGATESRVSAVELSARNGTRDAPSSEGGECIGYIEEGDWAEYQIDFGASTEHMEFRVASQTQGGLIEIRLDSPQGTLLAACTVPRTGGWQKWKTVKTTIIPTSGKKRICLVFRAKEVKRNDSPLWFAEVDETNTTIWAQFSGIDPNRELVEVNVRESVFYPETPGMNYITVRGFTLEQAATPWAPPTAEQIGLIGTHWSKGWIIESNVIRYSKCVGVTLGKYGDEWDNRSQSADAYNKTIKRALANGWNKETIGSHVVRDNHISHCEQAGIVGSMGAAFSTIIGNEIHDIYVHKLFGGAEIAGIKFHAPIDCLIAGNHIYRAGGPGGGIWLDWMTQGTRVVGNLLHDNSIDLFVEVNHGPYLVDHNLFLSETFLRDWSQGGAYAHNLIAGTISVKPQGRKTPIHLAHSTEVAELRGCTGGDNRFMNNIFLNGQNLGAYQRFVDSMVTEGNVFLESGADMARKADGIYLERSGMTPGTLQRPMVTSALLGNTNVSKLPFVNPDGTPHRLDTDYFGSKRNSENPAPGPFSIQTDREMNLNVWPKKRRE